MADYFDNSNNNDRNEQNSGDSYYQDYTAQNSYTVPPQEVNNGANGFQIAGLVLGIIGIVICCCYGVPSIIFGGLGLTFSLIGNGRNKGNSVGTAGLICSIIALILGVASTIFYVFSIIAAVSDPEFNSMYQEILQQYNR